MASIALVAPRTPSYTGRGVVPAAVSHSFNLVPVSLLSARVSPILSKPFEITLATGDTPGICAAVLITAPATGVATSKAPPNAAPSPAKRNLFCSLLKASSRPVNV